MDSSDNEFEVMLLKRQMRRQVTLTAVLASVAVAALAWGFMLAGAAARRTAQLRHVSAVVDSLDRVTTAQRQRISPIEDRVQSFGTLESRLSYALASKASRTEVEGLQDRLDAIGRRLAQTDSSLTLLGVDMSRHADQLAAAQIDSLGSLRRSLGVRLAALADTTRRNQATIRALDAHVGAIDLSRDHERTWTAARDVGTATALAMITAHVVDHSGR